MHHLRTSPLSRKQKYSIEEGARKRLNLQGLTSLGFSCNFKRSFCMHEMRFKVFSPSAFSTFATCPTAKFCAYIVMHLRAQLGFARVKTTPASDNRLTLPTSCHNFYHNRSLIFIYGFIQADEFECVNDWVFKSAYERSAGEGLKRGKQLE